MNAIYSPTRVVRQLFSIVTLVFVTCSALVAEDSLQTAVDKLKTAAENLPKKSKSAGDEATSYEDVSYEVDSLKSPVEGKLRYTTRFESKRRDPILIREELELVFRDARWQITKIRRGNVGGRLHVMNDLPSQVNATIRFLGL
jgi:hypothetical protein